MYYKFFFKSVYFFFWFSLICELYTDIVATYNHDKSMAAGNDFGTHFAWHTWRKHFLIHTSTKEKRNKKTNATSLLLVIFIHFENGFLINSDKRTWKRLQHNMTLRALKMKKWTNKEENEHRAVFQSTFSEHMHFHDFRFKNLLCDWVNISSKT